MASLPFSLIALVARGSSASSEIVAASIDHGELRPRDPVCATSWAHQIRKIRAINDLIASLSEFSRHAWVRHCRGCLPDVTCTRTILAALLWALALAMGSGAASAVEFVPIDSGYSHGLAKKSCDDRNPSHEHDRHCHSLARIQPPSSLRTKFKPFLDPAPHAPSPMPMVDAFVAPRPLAIDRQISPPLGAKTAFLAVFRYTTSLLF